MSTNIWHDRNEKPTRGCELGYIIVDKLGCMTHIFLCTTPEGFARRIGWYNFCFWAYADEILPPKDMLPARYDGFF